jgi:group I intron endonuclease
MTRTGRIYKIIHNQSNLVYVGSTFNILRQRWATHKASYKRGYKISIYPYFLKYGIENFKMILIKEYQVENRAHMEAYEQLWINKLKPINKQCAFNLLKKEKEKKYNKEYREKNKEEIREKDKKYREKYREKIKDNREKNKEKIREYRAQKKHCSQCGKLLSISNLSKHKKKYCKKREL